MAYNTYKGAVHETCSSYACARFLTRCRPQLFPIAVKLNPLTQFGRIGRADEVFALSLKSKKHTRISWCIEQETCVLNWVAFLFLVTYGEGSLFLR
jgi:hypothetical protein